MRPPALFRSFLGLLAPAICLLLVASPADARVVEFVDREVDAFLSSPSEIAVSPDGRYVYVSGWSQSIRFRRNASVGTLIYEEAGDGASTLAISPDGRAFYTSSPFGGVLGVHARDVERGTVGLVEEWAGTLAFGDRGGPYGIWLSPNAEHAYARLTDGIAVFARDASTGVLTWVQTVYDGVGDIEELAPRSLAFSADSRHVYVASAGVDGPQGLVVFSRDASTGALTWKQFLTAETVDALEVPREVRVSQDGRNVYLIGDDGIVSLRRDADDGTVSFIELDGLFGTKTLVIGPDDRFVYAFRSNYVETYSRNAADGGLALVETWDLSILELIDVEAASFSPDGHNLYLATTHGGSHFGGVAVLSRDSASGLLDIVQAILDDVSGDADGIGESLDAVVSPDGRHLYAGPLQADHDIGAFARSVDTGALEFLGSYGPWNGDEGRATTQFLAISPDGKHLYASTLHGTSQALTVLSRDATTGDLTFVEAHSSGSLPGLGTIRSMVVSPDGRYLYLASSTGDSILVFERDAASGGLTHQRTISGFAALERVNTLGLDPEGQYLYSAAASGPTNLAVWARDTDSGDLTFVEEHGIRGVGAYSDIAFSPDGESLYVGQDRLWAFSRNPSTGRLTFLEEKGFFLGNPLVTPDGRYVLAFGQDVSVFRRSSTGRLALVETEEIPGSDSAGASVLAADGGFAYVGVSYSQVAAFYTYRVAEGPCRVEWDGLCLSDDRFRVEVDWRDFEGNTGTATPVLNGSNDSGILWFFGPENWEMQLKVLDACGLNDRFWVFAAATTNVEYTLRVTDVAADVTKTYSNPLGNAASAITDTDAFATCSGGSSGASTAPVDLSSFQGGGSTVERRAYRQSVEPSIDKSFQPGLVKGIGGKCLDVEGGDPSDGTPTVLYDCHGDENQRWTKALYCPYHCLETFELQVFGDKCLQPGPDTGSEFRPLEIGACNGGEDLWETAGHFPQEFLLRHVETGLCADVLGSSADNLTPVGLFECDGGENQTWAFDEYLCEASPTGSCKNGQRFLVEAEWRDFEGNTGKGRVVPQDSDDSGLFWFFGPDNWEMLVKVLDACGLNDHFWVFAAATTNVEYTLRVTDTERREVREYFNPLGNAAPAITDTSAFATCETP